MADLIGKVLGTRYMILERLGEGGMADIYKASDARLERLVAVKVIRIDRNRAENVLQRFDREAKSLAQLTHPNIVPVIDYGDFEGIPFLVMPFLAGGTLRDKLGKPLPYNESARLLEPIADALAYAHAHGIIHRDVKPSNILISESGKPMLSDFGIAKLLVSDKASGLTTTGTGMGTPEYMAPEQVRGKAVDGHADIYSLGVVYYEMITGRTPYEGDTPMAVAAAQAADPLPPPGKFVPDLPPAVEAILLKALAKQPEDRHADMPALHKDLEKLARRESKAARRPAKTEKPVQQPSASYGTAFDFAAQAPAVVTPAEIPDDHTRLRIDQPGPIMPAPFSPVKPRARAHRIPKWLIWTIPAAILVVGIVVIALVATRHVPTTGTNQPANFGALLSGKRYKICEVTDIAGIDDKSVNQTIWNSALRVADQLGVEVVYLESQQESDYADNINAFLTQDCDLIIGAGFLVFDAIGIAADQHPEQLFMNFEVSYDPARSNISTITYKVDQVTFLAGYLAAATTRTGKVGTYGGMQFPSVTTFMDGFFFGVQKYNEMHGTDVSVIGWDPYSQTGLFLGSFSDMTASKEYTLTLMDEGADIIMPIGGLISVGTLEACQETGSCRMIGVDSDWAAFYPEYSDQILASVVKNMDAAILQVTGDLIEGNFTGGNIEGTLANGLIELRANGSLSGDLSAELSTLKEQIINGEVETVLSAGSEVVTERIAEIGSESNPINLIFLPNEDDESVLSVGQVMADWLQADTGLFFTVMITSNQEEAIQIMCDPGTRSIGYLPSAMYIFTSQQCDVDPALRASTGGWGGFWSAILVRRDRTDITSLSDLQGLIWGVPNRASMSGYVAARGLLQRAGVTFGEEFTLGGHPNTVMAVYNGEIDFGSVYYSPPQKPSGEAPWTDGEDPDIPQDLIDSCAPQETDGVQKLMCGEWQVMDARSAVTDQAPDIVQQVRILVISDMIPYETLVFSTDFPEDIRSVIVASMLEFPQSDVWYSSLGTLGYDNLMLATAADYEQIRIGLAAAGFTLEAIYGPQ